MPSFPFGFCIGVSWRHRGLSWEKRLQSVLVWRRLYLLFHGLLRTTFSPRCLSVFRSLNPGKFLSAEFSCANWCDLSLWTAQRQRLLRLWTWVTGCEHEVLLVSVWKQFLILIMKEEIVSYEGKLVKRMEWLSVPTWGAVCCSCYWRPGLNRTEIKILYLSLVECSLMFTYVKIWLTLAKYLLFCKSLSTFCMVFG